MPNPLQKSLNGYLSKIKRETGKLQLSSSKSLSSSKKWVLSSCKHPKKISFSFNHRRRPSKTRFKETDDVPGPGHAATLSDIDRFLEENFKSLCIHDDDDDDGEYRDRFERTWGPAVYDSPKQQDHGQGESSESRHSMDTMSNSSKATHVLPENCIAVLKYTAKPQEDFRRSMEEMMEEREVDWDLMEELLFCYLDLNDKKSHRFILSAFADLIISLRDKEKRITRKGLARSISTRAARDRLRKRITVTDAFPN